MTWWTALVGLTAALGLLALGAVLGTHADRATTDHLAACEAALERLMHERR
jgi:hypothetical protein